MEWQHSTKQMCIRTLFALAISVPILVYFTWGRETVLLAALLLVLSCNTFLLSAIKMSRTTFLNLGTIAPLIFIGVFLVLGKAPCMIEGVAKQSALFISYSIVGMFPIAVPALIYATGKKLLDWYPIPEIDLLGEPATPLRLKPIKVSRS